MVWVNQMPTSLQLIKVDCITLETPKISSGLMVWVNDAHITPANKGGLH